MNWLSFFFFFFNSQRVPRKLDYKNTSFRITHSILNKIAKSRAKNLSMFMNWSTEQMDLLSGVWNDHPRFVYNNENIENRISRAAVRADKGYSNIRN